MKRVIAIFSAFAIFTVMFCIPMQTFVNAEKTTADKGYETALYDFTESVGKSTSADNKAEYEANGIGYTGWGAQIEAAYDDESNMVIVSSRSKVQTNSTAGVTRLHKKVGDAYQAYNLEPNTQYIVSLKVRVISSSQFTDEAQTAHECYISMGYGARKTGSDTNYLNRMDKTLVKVVSTKAGSGIYTLATDNSTKKQLECGTEWQTATYVFTTPADLGEYDHALAFYGVARTGFRAEIDDVSVTKLGPNGGAVLLVDDYSSKTDILLGNVGETVSLPDISDRATDPMHKFVGWYTDKESTEQVTDYEFVNGVNKVYSNWAKPAKVTFLNTLTNTSTEVLGMSGEELKIPEKPFDPDNKAWFIGWYTDEGCTNLFTDTTFGYSDLILYSGWLTEIPGIVQNFEEYDKDTWKSIDRKGKVTYKDKSNSFYFAPCFGKESGVSASEGNYAIKLNWDPKLEKDVTKADGVNVNNPEAYAAADRYGATNNVIWVGNNIQNLHDYKVTFKYKVLNAKTDVSFYIASAANTNIYSKPVRSDKHHVELTASDEWKEFSFEFKTNFASDTANGIFLGVILDKNAEVLMYIDDVKIESLTSPTEALMTLVTNNGEDKRVIRALKGRELAFPEITHADNAKFLGWYTDEKLTIPFTETVCPEYNFTLYAKWSNTVISFKAYPFDKAYNGKLVKIENETGIGYDDDFAARWQYDGSKVYKTASESSTGAEVLWATRGNQKDHVLKIAEGLENGAIYKVSFYYKASKNTNIKTTITPISAYGKSIWVSGCYKTYSINTITVPEGGVGWTKAEYYIIADVLTSGSTVGDALFLTFKTATNKPENIADIYVDNVYVEKIVAPYVFFDCQNDEDLILVKGEAGEKIALPSAPQKFGYSFDGWYTDAECKNKFALDTFAQDTALTVYAGWKVKDSVTTSFENYKLTALGSCVVDKKVAATGKYSAHFGNRVEGSYNTGASYIPIGDGNVPFTLDINKNYVVTFKYRINKAGTSDIVFNFYGAPANNFWAGSANKLLLTTGERIKAGDQELKEKTWITVSMFIDCKVIRESEYKNYNTLFLCLKGFAEGDLSIDDVTITAIPSKKGTVLIDNGGCSSLPNHYFVNLKENFYNRLPKNPTVKGKHFIGYYIKDSSKKLVKLEHEKAVITSVSEPIKVYAKFIDVKVAENFEDGSYVKNAQEMGYTYTVYDFDYEIYDSEKEGNSNENVTSGRYSLHKKGKSQFVENAVLLTYKNQLAEGQRYTVKFKVKMGEYLQTDGAIKIVSNRNWVYSWATTGDYYPVIAISDLTDGTWHEVSYTFNSVEAFAAIQVPGYVELFMDDFEFTLVDKNTPLSTPVMYTEYVPALRNADGSLVNGDNGTIDVTAIIDHSMYEKDFNLLWVVIPVGSLVVIVLIILILLIIKKKKKA